MIWMECELYEYGGADNMGNRTSRPLSRFIRGAMRVARPPGLAAGYALRDAWLACAGLHPNKKPRDIWTFEPGGGKPPHQASVFPFWHSARVDHHNMLLARPTAAGAWRTLCRGTTWANRGPRKRKPLTRRQWPGGEKDVTE